MFPTIFYICILIYQGIYTDTNVRYNQDIANVNRYVSAGDYSNANLLLQNIQAESLFNTDVITNTQQLLLLKSNLNDSSKELSTNVFIETLLNLKNQDNMYALQRLRYQMTDLSSSDSLIKLYELIASKSVNNPIKKTSIQKLMVQKTVWDSNEALQLLNMMKKKEKLLL